MDRAFSMKIISLVQELQLFINNNELQENVIVVDRQLGELAATYMHTKK